MKRTYEKPELNVTSIEETDAIALSSLNTTFTSFGVKAFSNIIEEY